MGIYRFVTPTARPYHEIRTARNVRKELVVSKNATFHFLYYYFSFVVSNNSSHEDWIVILWAGKKGKNNG